ncbi:hypothetical protein AALA21_00730 [Eggerthellaceae bacterium 3-80]|nr:hypothetical protein D7W09_01585 [bacterium D16-34]
MEKKLHPSPLLILDLDERIDSRELRAEIDRCYSYIGTPVIRTHAPSESNPDAPVSNIMRLNINNLGTHRYLDSSDDGADALWNDVLLHWLYNQIHKLDNQMKIYNLRQREEGAPDLMFEWLEINLESGKLIARIKLDSASGVSPEVCTNLDALRSALNAGALGQDVVSVSMPSAASFEAQKREGMAAKAKRDAEAAAEAARVAAEEQAQIDAAEAQADALFLESPSLVEQAAKEQAAQRDAQDPILKARVEADLARPENEMTAEEIVAKRIAEEAELHEKMEARYTLPEADYELEFLQWTIHYADGTERDFDSTTSAFVA